MSSLLAELNNHLGVLLVGIGETLRHSLSDIVLRVEYEQAKTACRNLQLCAGVYSGIEGNNNTIVQCQRDMCKTEDRFGYILAGREI